MPCLSQCPSDPILWHSSLESAPCRIPCSGSVNYFCHSTTRPMQWGTCLIFFCRENYFRKKHLIFATYAIKYLCVKKCRSWKQRYIISHSVFFCWACLLRLWWYLWLHKEIYDIILVTWRLDRTRRVRNVRWLIFYCLPPRYWKSLLGSDVHSH